MHDTLVVLLERPVHRRYHHDQLTFGLVYAWSENFVLPLSHDEVVHVKGSLLGKMPGDQWQRFANLRALYGWMWAHPGKQLLFMGARAGPGARVEPRPRARLAPARPTRTTAGVRDLLRELNRVEAEQPGAVGRDYTPDGLPLARRRRPRQLGVLVPAARVAASVRGACVANLTPVPRHGYRVGLPRGGRWVDVLNTDDERWGGSGDHPGRGRRATARRGRARPTLRC